MSPRGCRRPLQGASGSVAPVWKPLSRGISGAEADHTAGRRRREAPTQARQQGAAPARALDPDAARARGPVFAAGQVEFPQPVERAGDRRPRHAEQVGQGARGSRLLAGLIDEQQDGDLTEGEIPAVILGPGNQREDRAAQRLETPVGPRVPCARPRGPRPVWPARRGRRALRRRWTARSAPGRRRLRRGGARWRRLRHPEGPA
jgi:hypothetical protein